MKLPTENELRDLWLKKYHNTDTEEIVKKYPKEILMSANWFKLFPCTEEQSREWEKECKEMLLKKYKFHKRTLEMSWPYIYLNCSPNVKNENE